nr:EOG090X04AR [Macrothrix elegans]
MATAHTKRVKEWNIYDDQKRDCKFLLYTRAVEALPDSQHVSEQHWTLVAHFPDGVIEEAKIKEELAVVTISPKKLLDIAKETDTGRKYQAALYNCQNWLKEFAAKVSTKLEAAMKKFNTWKEEMIATGRRLYGPGETEAKVNGDSGHHVNGNDAKDKKTDKERDGKDRERGRDRDRDRDREKDKDRDRRSGRSDRHKSRSRERSRDRSRDRKDRDRRRSRSRDRDRRRSRSPRDSRKRSKSRDRKRSRSPRRDRDSKRGRRSPTPIKKALPELTVEERDARTVFCMQLSQRVRPRDLEEFFSAVGKVRDVRLITCNKTRRFKGLCYVEFADPESVPLAIALTGQRLLGVPIVVQPTQAEKNRLAGSNLPALSTFGKGQNGPMRLYVGSLHFNITEDMLKSIFEPFGKIEHMQLMTDTESGRSKGYGFITFRNAEDAKKAMEQLNGFELAGRPMKINHVTEHFTGNHAYLDSDEMDRAGIDLGATGRLQLMAKLAQGTGLEIPAAAQSALNLQASIQAAHQQALPVAAVAPPIATQCFMLSNMFDPNSETHPLWHQEIMDDVMDECDKHGGVLHIYVDKASPQGNVYVKCPSVTVALNAVNALHGRWFAGRIITAAYVPLLNYHSLFPDSITATTPLRK